MESAQKSDEEREEAEESVASLGGGDLFFGLYAHDHHFIVITSCQASPFSSWQMTFKAGCPCDVLAQLSTAWGLGHNSHSQQVQASMAQGMK